MIVSKTDYLIYRECPKNAWLKLHKPDIYYSSELSDFEKSIIETGNEVEIEARKIFPTGILIENRDASAIRLTQELLAKKERTIFQAVFSSQNGFFAAVDILRYDESKDAYDIYEIKATNQVNDKTHLYDLTFQVILLESCGIKIDKANILHLNSEYVRQGDLDITKLFSVDDITEKVEDIKEKVRYEMNEAMKYLGSDKEPNGYCSCMYKGRSGHCSTFQYSNYKSLDKEEPEYSVHDIARIGLSKKKLTELIDSGITNILDVPEHIELTEIQKNQVEATILDRVTKKEDKIRSELNSLVFPLYFLDYETFPSALPRFDGFSPYQQIPFQYSLHILETPNSEPIHREFLHTGSDDPSRSFSESMQKNIGRIGNIIVWNKKFECKINEELARRIPESRSFIEDVNARIYDLMDIFTNQYYVHKDFFGSTSIKYVLPVLVPELSYKNLPIREGGTASMRWNEMTTGRTSGNEEIDESHRREIAENLKKYCKLDTYAMYAIWKKLSEM